MARTTFDDAAALGVENFVVNCGRYWYGASWGEYEPNVKVDDPLQDSAILFWALASQQVSPEYFRIVKALQDYTRVGVNGWSIKNRGGGLGFEIYLCMYPEVIKQKYGHEVAAMKLSRFEPNLNYFTGFEERYFGQPHVEYDQAGLGLHYLWSLHFDLSDELFRDRSIHEYTFGAGVSPVRPMPAFPAPWKGFVWDKKSYPKVEQYGFVVDPVAHEEIMLQWIEDVVSKSGWPEQKIPDPREFLVPWLYEQTLPHRRLGLTYKPRKGGFGVYYRLNCSSFMRFLDEYEYPSLLIEKVSRNRPRLEHLWMDVATVFLVSDGETKPFRTSLYGTV